MRHSLLLIPMALLVLPLGGCYVVAEPAAPVAVETYEPVYYDGHVVEYDTVGTPFVYVRGEVRYVPRDYVHYDVLVRHYRAHAHARGWAEPSHRDDGPRGDSGRGRAPSRPHQRRQDHGGRR